MEIELTYHLRTLTDIIVFPFNQGPPGEQGLRGPRGDKGEKVRWTVKTVGRRVWKVCYRGHIPAVTWRMVVFD